jgi:Holliday junction resolvasome RuvABC endonuclease subunit
MNTNGTVFIRGIDPGTTLIGVSEWTFNYQLKDEKYQGEAFIEDFYTVRVPTGKGMDTDHRLLWINEYFTNMNRRKKSCDSVLCIENVPYVQNQRNASILHQAEAAIVIPHVAAGYDVMRIPPSTWRKEAIGDGAGNWKKEQVMHWAIGGNLPVDADTLEEDAVDALCIGLAALKRITAKVGFDMKNWQERLSIMR